MEDMWDIKRVLESQGSTHNKVEVQSNSESTSLTLSPTRSPGPTRIWVIYICMKRLGDNLSNSTIPMVK
jgi:hypothetical protein